MLHIISIEKTMLCEIDKLIYHEQHIDNTPFISSNTKAEHLSNLKKIILKTLVLL